MKVTYGDVVRGTRRAVPLSRPELALFLDCGESHSQLLNRTSKAAMCDEHCIQRLSLSLVAGTVDSR